MRRMKAPGVIALAVLSASTILATTSSAAAQTATRKNPIATSCMNAIIQARLTFAGARMMILAAGLRIAASSTETDSSQALADGQQAGRDLANALQLLGSSVGGNPPAFERAAARCWRWASSNG